jgi:endogenous inhibitor of DNA gyrase (YacG/DUF329 family)
MLDLNRWLSGDYRVAGASDIPVPDTDELEESDESNGRWKR